MKVLHFLIPFFITASLFGQQANEPLPYQKLDYTISHSHSPVKIDGVLDEPAWEKATTIKVLYEYQPGDNVPPPVETDCLVTYDDSKLYVAFRAFDSSPSQIRAHVLDRDSIDAFVQDDFVGFLIDTFNDERRFYQFRVNPLGIQADAYNSELEGLEDWSFDLIWDSAGKITDKGYVVEMAIPFNQIRFPRVSGVETWGVEAFRSWPRSIQHRMSSHYNDRNKSCLACQFNKLAGFEGIAPGRNVEVDPTLTSHRTDETNPDNGETETHSKVDPGVTARWGISSNLSLIGTINPDFSQVEADVAQLDVNTQFALSYPEKRPFFLEGKGIFTTQINAVYTRTIVDPDYALKLTGKQGPNTVGAFVAKDNFNNLIFPGNQSSQRQSYDQDILTTVFRYKRDLGKLSSIGGLYSGREGDDYHNRLFGFDGFLRFTGTDIFRYQFLHSQTEYPLNVAIDHKQPLSAFGANGLVTLYEHSGRDWYWRGSYTGYNPELRVDSGFVPRVDIRHFVGNFRRNFWGNSDKWYTFFDVGVQGIYTENYDGQRTNKTLSFFTDYEGPMQSVVYLDYIRNSTLYRGVYYNKDVQDFSVSIQPGNSLVLSLFEAYGNAIDFANSRPAKELDLEPTLTYKIGRRIETSLDHTFQRLSENGKRLFTANLTQTRVVYHFNARTLLRGILQYTNVTKNPDLYTFPVDENSKALFTQFLFSYKLNPQTVLFIGYSDNYDGSQDLSLTQTNRTLFLKVGYAWIL